MGLHPTSVTKEAVCRIYSCFPFRLLVQDKSSFFLELVNRIATLMAFWPVACIVLLSPLAGSTCPYHGAGSFGLELAGCVYLFYLERFKEQVLWFICIELCLGTSRLRKRAVLRTG